jgi:molecular chaperone DnaJ
MPSAPDADYYALLGIQAGANDQELRKAWRELAARWHPDRAGETATAMFQQLSAAYTVLSDPVARMAYDRRRRAAAPSSAAVPRSPAPTNAARPPTRPVPPAVMLSRLTGNLTTLLARGAVHLDETGFITLVLRETEAAQGGMVQVTLRVDQWCPACSGKQPSEPCGRCDGKRKVQELFSAWLAVPPGVNDGEELIPSAELPGMVERVRFRVSLRKHDRSV